MNLLDLCAGAGGLPLGAIRAGFDVEGVELDEEACTTHVRAVGPCRQRDITTLHFGGVPSDHYKVVAGGVPCQPFSHAGMRLGPEDPRGELYKHLIRIGSEAGADAIVMENVRGLATWKDPRGVRMIDTVWSAFGAAGYRARWTILDAKDFGVPQTRHRLFIVGFKSDDAWTRFEWPQTTHGEGKLPYVTVRQALDLGPGDYRVFRGNRTTGYQGVRSIPVDEPSTSITTRSNPDWLDPIDGVKRRLTPAGCAILQGFPADFAWHATSKKSLFRQIGNAVPPALAEAMLRCVKRAL